jgi:hypothetical protein
MRALEVVRGAIAKLAASIMRPQGSEFVCGQCERWQRCGLPPNKRCIVMAEQIARNGGRSAKRTVLYQC